MGEIILNPFNTNLNPSYMKNIILIAFLSFNGLNLLTDSNLLQAQDVNKVAPGVYKLVADTLGLRIFETVWTPGAVAAFHTHPDYAAYVVEGGTLDVIEADGKKTTFELTPGMALIAGTESHSAINTGKTTIKVIVVETTRPRR